MFRNSFQKGCLTVFYSGGIYPCEIWGINRRNGHAKRVHDVDINSLAMELLGCNVSTMFMFIPRDPKISLGIKLPFLVLLIKNLNKYFTFEIKIMDSQKFMRRFRVSNFQSKTTVKPFCTAMPIGMSPGWNQIHFNLADLTRRAYGTDYMEAVRLQVHANTRIRRIYFADKLYTEEQLPIEYRLIPSVAKKPVVKYRVPVARPPTPVKPRLTYRKTAPGPVTKLPHIEEFIREPELQNILAKIKAEPPK